MLVGITRVLKGKSHYRIQTTDDNGTPLNKHKKLRFHIGELIKKYEGKFIDEEVVDGKVFLFFY